MKFIVLVIKFYIESYRKQFNNQFLDKCYKYINI